VTVSKTIRSSPTHASSELHQNVLLHWVRSAIGVKLAAEANNLSVSISSRDLEANLRKCKHIIPGGDLAHTAHCTAYWLWARGSQTSGVEVRIGKYWFDGRDFILQPCW